MRRLLMFIAMGFIGLGLLGCEAIEDPISNSTVTLTFTGDFEGSLDPLEIPVGRPADLPEVEGDGAFLGWYDADNPRYELTSFDPVFEDVTLVALFESSPVRVLYDRGDGGYIEPTLAEEPLETLPTPSRLNYVFEGWFLDPNLQSRVELPLEVTEDTTLYANWRYDGSTSLNILEYETSIINMVEEVRTSVLGISNIIDADLGTGSSGSGVIYRREGDTYWVVTNHHVLEDFTELEIIYERNDLIFTIDNEDIEFIGSDPTTDIGVLTFTSELDFAVAEFKDYYDLELGQYVYAIGSPLGFEYFNSVNQGIISGLSRFFENSDGLGEFAGFVIQHDAAINPGNSGGALFTSAGEFIGINTFKIDSSPTGRNLEGLGFAVPSNTITRVTRDLEEFGEIRRPFFGISSAVLVSSCDQDFGVCVQAVVADSSAESLGIQEGDVIIGFQNDTMDEMLRTNNFEQLREAILNSRVGQDARVEVIRDGETIITDYAPLVLHPDDRD